MKILYFITPLLLLAGLPGNMNLNAQPYSPAAGIAGSTAIHADDPVFRSWAESCDLQRGPGIITYPDSVSVTQGDSSTATGKADNLVVSLGDGGNITLFFKHPIIDEPGPDFAVFENSFDGTFLELGFVEVSSDSKRFVRFPAQSLTQVDSQVWSFGTLNPENLYNLAGKFQSGWGSPFDLSEIADSSGIDLQNINAVRIIDVVGILDESHGSKDASGRLINDPFPTPFESGGFDLDAVGVINQAVVSFRQEKARDNLKIYPVPCETELYIEDPDRNFRLWILYDLQGRKIREGRIKNPRQNIKLQDVPRGGYLLRCQGETKDQVTRIIKTGL